MFALQKQIKKFIKLDLLSQKINIKKFNDIEKELIKIICYQSYQDNFINYASIKEYKKNCSYFFNLKNIFLIKKIIKFLYLLIIKLFKSKKKLENLNVDIIFFLSMEFKSQMDTKPIIEGFSKKIVLVDKPDRIVKQYKKIFKKTKIINLRDYFIISDYLSALFFSFIFLKKLYVQRNLKKVLKVNFGVCFNFFLRKRIFLDIIKKINSNKIFLDRNNGLNSNYFISEFKKHNKSNKVFSYGLNGIALNNDLIFAHYLYSDIDFLFCYGDLDKFFIKKLFKMNNFNLLKKPKKIIPIGSIRNFKFKFKKTQNNFKIKKFQFNFLYIKSNLHLYNYLDEKCFKKFCIFIKKYFPTSNIIVKEKYDEYSEINEDLIKKKILLRKNIYDSTQTKPEEIFSRADFVVGTTSAALAQAIYYDIPVICLDNKIVISSLLKNFCSIYIESIDDLIKYKDQIISTGNQLKKNRRFKKFIFKKTVKNPVFKILDKMK